MPYAIQRGRCGISEVMDRGGELRRWGDGNPVVECEGTRAQARRPSPIDGEVVPEPGHLQEIAALLRVAPQLTMDRPARHDI